MLEPKPVGPVTLKLSSLKPGHYRLAISHIGYEKNDPFSAYLKMGKPDQLTPAQVADLKALATGQPDDERDIVVDAGGIWQADFPMREGDVVLVRLTRSG